MYTETRDEKNKVIEENIINGEDKKGDVFDSVSSSQVDLVNFRMYIKQNTGLLKHFSTKSDLQKRKTQEERDYIISPLSFRMYNTEKVFFKEEKLEADRVAARIRLFRPIEALAENKPAINRQFFKFNEKGLIELEKMSFAQSEMQVTSAFKFNLRAKEFPEYLKLI